VCISQEGICQYLYANKRSGVISIAVCVARNTGANAIVLITGAGTFLAGSRSMSVRPFSTQAACGDWDYFAHPYASWERGLNENTNGLIRQYFQKYRDLPTITHAEEVCFNPKTLLTVTLQC
jgi:hypothetical protein